MEGFDKIKNIKLSDLDEEHTLEKELKKNQDSPDVEAAVSPEKPKDEGEISHVKEQIHEPVGRHYVIDADITNEEIRNFRLAHEYRRPTILLVNVLAIAFVVYTLMGKNTAKNWRFTFVMAVLIVVYYPIMLIVRSRHFKEKNVIFQQIFHYMLDEEGIHLQLEKEAIDVEWKYVQKLLLLKSSAVVYTGKVNAWIIPTKDMGDQKDEIIAFLKEKTAAGKK